MVESTKKVKEYSLTDAAKWDLFEIWNYIAEDNPEFADKIEAELLDACRRLTKNPFLGHFRSDLTKKSIRFFAVRDTYLIVYDPATEPLLISRILHGSRDAESELED